jgi:hypothetical protein
MVVAAAEMIRKIGRVGDHAALLAKKTPSGE